MQCLFPNIRLSALLLTFIGCVSGVRADVFVRDDAGVVHLTDMRPDEGFALLLRERSPASTAAPTRTAAARPNRPLLDAQIRVVADTVGLDVELLHAVVATESAYRNDVRSPKGAAGLMQLMPETARRFGVHDTHDPGQNLLGGALYLRQLLQRYDADLELALAAYNAGEGAVERHGRRIPPYRETRRYVPTVLQRYRAASVPMYAPPSSTNSR